MQYTKSSITQFLHIETSGRRRAGKRNEEIQRMGSRRVYSYVPCRDGDMSMEIYIHTPNIYYKV